MFFNRLSLTLLAGLCLFGPLCAAASPEPTEATVAPRALLASLKLLTPLMDGEQALTKPAPDTARPAPVLGLIENGEVHDALHKEFAGGSLAALLALDSAAQRIAGAKTPEPLWLLLSSTYGDQQRGGFWLREVQGERWIAEPLIDLMTDTRDLADGSFEEVFAYELGHQLLARLLPELPEGYSRTPHGVFALTDDPSAFREGFALHFQALIRRLTRNERLKAHDLGLEFSPFVPFWRNNLERSAVIAGIRSNLFVHSQLALPGDNEGIGRRDLSNLFDRTRLKNGNQMLASESVVATLFYRAFAPGPSELEPLLARYERLFYALRDLRTEELTADSPIFLQFAEQYARDNPEDGRRVLRLLVETTYGATADPALARQTEALASHGRRGDFKGYMAELRPARASMSRLIDVVQRAPRGLRGALGPAIWLVSDNTRASAAPDAPLLTINLNTAEREQLASLPGINPILAERAVSSRRQHGPFRSLSDFAARLNLSPDQALKLSAQAQAMERLGRYARP